MSYINITLCVCTALCTSIYANDKSPKNQPFSTPERIATSKNLSRYTNRYQKYIHQSQQSCENQIAFHKAHRSSDPQKVTYPQLEREANHFASYVYAYIFEREKLNKAIDPDTAYNYASNAARQLISRYIYPSFTSYDTTTLYGISYPLAEHFDYLHPKSSLSGEIIVSELPERIAQDADKMHKFIAQHDKFPTFNSVLNVQHQCLNTIQEATNKLYDNARSTYALPSTSRFFPQASISEERHIPYCGWTEAYNLVENFPYYGSDPNTQRQGVSIIRLLHRYHEMCFGLMQISDTITYNHQTLSESTKSVLEEKINRYQAIAATLSNFHPQGSILDNHGDRDEILITDPRAEPLSRMYLYYLPAGVDNLPLSSDTYHKMSYVVEAVSDYMSAIHKTITAYEMHHNRITLNNLLSAQILCSSISKLYTLVQQECRLYSTEMMACDQACDILHDYINKLNNKSDKKHYADTKTRLQNLKRLALHIQEKRESIQKITCDINE